MPNDKNITRTRLWLGATTYSQSCCPVNRPGRWARLSQSPQVRTECCCTERTVSSASLIVDGKATRAVESFRFGADPEVRTEYGIHYGVRSMRTVLAYSAALVPA